MSTVSDPLGRVYPEMDIMLRGISRRKASGRLVPRPNITGENPNIAVRPVKRPIPEGSLDISTDGRRPIAEEDEITSIVSGDEDEIDDTDASSSECYRICRGLLFRKLLQEEVARFIEISKTKYTRKKADSYRF